MWGAPTYCCMAELDTRNPKSVSGVESLLRAESDLEQCPYPNPERLEPCHRRAAPLVPLALESAHESLNTGVGYG